MHCEAGPVIGSLTLVKLKRERYAILGRCLNHNHVVGACSDVGIFNAPSLIVGGTRSCGLWSRFRNIEGRLFPVGIDIVVSNFFHGVNGSHYRTCHSVKDSDSLDGCSANFEFLDGEGRVAVSVVVACGGRCAVECEVNHTSVRASNCHRTSALEHCARRWVEGGAWHFNK